MKKLTKEELEAIEVCQHEEKGNCEDCPAKYCNCFVTLLQQHYY